MHEPDHAPVSLEETPHGDVLVRVRGDLDLALAPAIALGLELAEARAAPDGRVLAHLGGVTFLDSTGLRALLLSHGRLGDRFALMAPSRAVRRLLAVAHVTEVVRVVEDPADP